MLSLISRFKAEKRWKNKCLLLELIHLSIRRDNTKWTIRDTARMLKLSIGAASENLKLAQNIDSVNHCKSRNQALKYLKENK